MDHELLLGDGTLKMSFPPHPCVRMQLQTRVDAEKKYPSECEGDDSVSSFLPPQNFSHVVHTNSMPEGKCLSGASADEVGSRQPPSPYRSGSQPHTARRWSSVPTTGVDGPADKTVVAQPNIDTETSRASQLPLKDTEKSSWPDESVVCPTPKASQDNQPSPELRITPTLKRRVSQKLRVAGSPPDDSEDEPPPRALSSMSENLFISPALPARYGERTSAGAVLAFHGRSVSLTELQKGELRTLSTPPPGVDDVWGLPPLRVHEPHTSPVLGDRFPGPPGVSFVKLSSLDNLLTYKEECQKWKRASSNSSRSRDSSQQHLSVPPSLHEPVVKDLGLSSRSTEAECHNRKTLESALPEKPTKRFRHTGGEIGFCFTIAMTQLLAEYLISGFAVELLKTTANEFQVGTHALSTFWPASVLSLILSATLLIFARLSDMYGGYLIFLFGVVWLAIWTLIPGFCTSPTMLDVSRAMQGLAIAAYTPSTYAMVGTIYPEGQKRNLVLGLYGACAPLGFYMGLLVAAALPIADTSWYFNIASALSIITALTAYLTVPADRANRRSLGMKMDFTGAVLITSGLVLVSYALAFAPLKSQDISSGFTSPSVIGPLIAGLVSLVLAVYWEGWRATCPLLPFDFFKPKGIKPFVTACLLFYGCFGVWLYQSTVFFDKQGVELALWYTPTAVGGIILAIAGGSLLHLVPITFILLLSGLAWIAAPLILALSSQPINYWAVAFPSTLCATIGLDLTFTVSIVFLSSVQPLRYQGLAGAICSVLINVAMSFSLSISQLIMNAIKAGTTVRVGPMNPATEAAATAAANEGLKYSNKVIFLYATASAAVGFIICTLFVRISRSVVSEKPGNEEVG